MTDPAADSMQLVMPARCDLVAEAIARFDTAGLRSQLLALDTTTLEQLGLMLSDRSRSVTDAVAWLNKELGGTDEEPAVNKNAVYRFADHFRRLYDQVRAEHARRIARLSVEHATAGHVDTMAKVATARLVDLIAERLVEAPNLEELDARELSATIATLDGISKARFKAEELALKQAEAERRAAKLEADVQVIRQKLAAVPLRLKAAMERLEKIESAQAAGGKVAPELFASIRAELAALAHETREAA